MYKTRIFKHLKLKVIYFYILLILTVFIPDIFQSNNRILF